MQYLNYQFGYNFKKYHLTLINWLMCIDLFNLNDSLALLQITIIIIYIAFHQIKSVLYKLFTIKIIILVNFLNFIFFISALVIKFTIIFIIFLSAWINCEEIFMFYLYFLIVFPDHRIFSKYFFHIYSNNYLDDWVIR